MKKEKSFSTTPIEPGEVLSPTRPAGASAPVDGALLERLPPGLRHSSRFEVREALGRGAFGQVFLAYDHSLSRAVALKVPRVDKLTAADSLSIFVREARAAASLRHPGIVTVYDVHSDQDGVFIVLEFVQGRTLTEHVDRGPFPLEDAVRLVVEVARAAAYAHEHGLVHRDLKPSNILIDDHGKIRITDFGLAIHERVQATLARDVAGTPAFMAPEQVRGETHRLDGRTDIWALGVILFWLLTGRRPFRGSSDTEVFEEVLHREPRPPRQLRPAVPRELDRICLKCLAKRMSDRYATASDLADDLEDWLHKKPPQQETIAAEAAPAGQGDSSSKPAAVVVPKGLRSYDEHDADFFLALLPGPFDRHGLPESVRFWKQRIEETDPAATFSVGLMYGPSGCGKTSLVRAGLLPRLEGHVRWVYVEAAPDDTENRLCRALARAVPALPPAMSLVEMLAELREGRRLNPGEKVFIALDQFEQWLSGRVAEENEPLVAALRHCDGGRVQCLVMVRDDFSMAATRFMNALEVPIAEGQNCAAVDVFHRDHARRVLQRFGEAFGRLSPDAPEEAEAFVEQAVELLSEGNAISPVRLSAFAELMRHQDWTASALRTWKGRKGLGIALLEKCLGDGARNPAHRQHREAARRVLAALMPEDRTSLKGRMRSKAELMAAAGYESRPRDFRDLLNMLDKELRLITPADPQQEAGEDSGSEPDDSSRRERHYQLAHDYLVPSLSTWLAGKQRETRRGRAELRLEERAMHWSVAREKRQLPSSWETAQIFLLTRRGAWAPSQAAMMRQAAKTHLTKTAAVLLMLSVAAVAAVFTRGRMQEAARARQSEGQVNRLLTADIQ
ncbi:MAG: serine/threonine-protein kinase, partial [Planctomycetes bacterium]|nr:serine/threonine-protein kinase [Planctomycetota bacterium]